MPRLKDILRWRSRMRDAMLADPLAHDDEDEVDPLTQQAESILQSIGAVLERMPKAERKEWDIRWKRYTSHYPTDPADAVYVTRVLDAARAEEERRQHLRLSRLLET